MQKKRMIGCLIVVGLLGLYGCSGSASISGQQTETEITAEDGSLAEDGVQLPGRQPWGQRTARIRWRWSFLGEAAGHLSLLRQRWK